MIKLAMRRVRPGREDQLRKWMAELNRRSAEVRETFAQEGARHEQAYLLKTADGPVLIYAMEAAHHARASSMFRTRHCRSIGNHVMAQVLAEPASAELLYECEAGPGAC